MSRAPDPTPGAQRGTTPEASPNDTRAEGLTLLAGLQRRAATGVAAGQHAAAAIGHASQALRLSVAATGLSGSRVLMGHVLGMHLELQAGGLHGPRQTPAYVYLFSDAVAVRPSDDAPMSTVPLLGLHMVFPPLAVTRWLYKAGRIEHANLDLVKVAGAFEDALPLWTVDDFAEADAKLDVCRLPSLTAPVHVYERLGFAHIWLPLPGRNPLRLQSSLPVSAEEFACLWTLLSTMSWPHGASMTSPHEDTEAPH